MGTLEVVKWVLRLPWVAPRRNDEAGMKGAQLTAIESSSADAILSYDLDRIITSWNPAAERLFGYTAGEMIGQSYLSFVQIDKIGESNDLRERAWSDHTTLNFRTVRLHKDGSAVPVSMNISPIYDLSGAVNGVSAIYRDMTDLKDSEKQNVLSAAIVAASNDAILSYSLDGKITSWNPAAIRIFGYSAEEMISQQFSVLVPPDRASEATDLPERLARGEKIANYETVRLRKDGSTVPISLSVSLLYDSSGAVIGGSSVARDLTELKELEVRKSLLAVIVESSSEAIWSYTLDGIITVWNPAAERIFGYAADEMLGQIALDMYPSEKWDETVELIDKIRNGKSISNFETVRLRKDGTAFPVSLTISPIYDHAGAVIGGSTFAQDITKLKTSEMRNALLAAIVASSKDAILSFNLDGIATSWNPGAERIFGYSADEIIGQPPLVFVHSEKSDESADILESIRRGQPIEHFETVRLRKNKSAVPVSMDVSPIYDLTGAVVGASAIYRDITELKMAEQKFRDILESSPDAMVIADKTGTIVIVNSQTEEIFGYHRDEILGRSVELLMPRRFRTIFPGYWERFFSDPKVELMGGGLQLYGHRKDGQEFPVEIRLSPVETANGVLVVATIRDVSVHKNMIRQLKEMNALRSEFVAIVSHDLRSPMTSINGYAQELLNEWDATDDARKIEYLQIIVRNTEHLAEFVEDVLQVARIEAGEYTYNIRPFDIRLLVQRVLDETASAGDGRRFEFAAPTDFPNVLGDEDRQWQVLTNLLSNAVKFSPAGEPIVVGLSCIDDFVQVAVTDCGIGIATDDMSKLFMKFGRVSNHGVLKTPGNGLGLYICKTLVEAQGGRIWCESSPGRGSTFTFTIPVAR